MTIVGLPDAAVQESRERVQTAVKNAGLHFPRHRIVVNLALATVRNDGSSYDFPFELGGIVLTLLISGIWYSVSLLLQIVPMPF
jgi:magnesium chelatase family protein